MKKAIIAAATVGILPLVHTGTTAAAPAEPPTYPKGYKTNTCGNTTDRMVLTFDDAPSDHGSSRTYDDVIRQATWLRSQGVRAMYFVTTDETTPAVIRKLRSLGHYVGGHSMNHPRFPQITDVELARQAKGGVKSNLIRPPFGDYNQHNKEILGSMGYRVCTWAKELSTHDWDKTKTGRRSAESIRSIVRKGAGAEGGVVLGHLWTNFPDAVPGIVADMRKQGREFCRNDGPVGADVPFPLDC